MRVTVRLFARLRDLAGTGELVREVPESATVQTVWKLLTAEMPSLLEYERTMSVAVGGNRLLARSEPDRRHQPEQRPDRNHRPQQLKVIGNFGRSGNFAGQFNQPHGIAVDSKGNIYVAENRGRRIHKFTSARR